MWHPKLQANLSHLSIVQVIGNFKGKHNMWIVDAVSEMVKTSRRGPTEYGSLDSIAWFSKFIPGYK